MKAQPTANQVANGPNQEQRMDPVDTLIESYADALRQIAEQHHSEIEDADAACNLLYLDTERCKKQISDLISNPIQARTDLGVIGVLMTSTQDLVDGEIARIISNTRRMADIRTAAIARAALNQGARK